MTLRNSFIACAVLIALGTSCTDNTPTDNTGPEASYGLVRITVKTTGADLDDGYAVSLAGGTHTRFAANGSLTMKAPPGRTTVELTDVASNCVVDGSSSVSVDVPRGNTTDVTFVVTCAVTGFQVSVSTTGSDTPPSYSLKMSTRNAIPISVNANLLVNRLEPGSYTLRVESPIASCQPAGADELRVDLPPRTVVPVTFKFACSAVVRLEKIAYSIDSTCGPANSCVAVARPDGTGQFVIGAGSGPSWAPDGKTFAYTVNSCTDFYYYYDYCSTTVQAIDPETLNSSSLAIGSMPAWSPNNDVVAFIESNGSLSLTPVDRAAVFVRLSIPKPLEAALPAWSPDGRMLAFVCTPKNGFSRLCVINNDGSGFRQLTDSTSNPVAHPSWSRDGNTIVFASVGTQATSIAVMPSAGGAITILTQGFDPAWSRDGTKILFARSDGLFTMNPDGSNEQRLTTGKHREPAWRP